jgi:isopenicillin-N epimerase
MNFFVREYEPLLDAARATLATFVGADPANLAFVPNATTGVNTVLRSLTFAPTDELLTTNHTYNACRNGLDFIAARSHANIIIAEIPFPIETSEQVIEAVMAKVSPRTKLVLLDHITSPTGVIFPLETLIPKLSALGIATLIDGAHAPGMIPLALQTLGATYYAGNCHKWLCAPKGAGFLYVQPEQQSQIRPLTISHGANTPSTSRSKFHLEFDWTGTQDPSAYFCVADAIQVVGALLPGGWPELMNRNRQLALEARQMLCDHLQQPLPCPEEMIGSLAAIPLPKEFGVPHLPLSGVDPLQAALWEKYRVEVPIIPWMHPQQKLVRISAQGYNHREQYQTLAEALTRLRSCLKS